MKSTSKYWILIENILESKIELTFVHLKYIKAIIKHSN